MERNRRIKKEVYIKSHEIWNKYNPTNKIKIQKGVGTGRYKIVIHHKDGNHDNNNINNLQKITKGLHTIIHRTGKTHSNFTKRKISKSRKGIAAFTGMKHTEKTKQKIRLALTGKKLSEKIKKKMSHTHKNRFSSMTEKELKKHMQRSLWSNLKRG